MTRTIRLTLLAGAAVLAASSAEAPAQDRSAMTFFVSSANPGRAADLGGLAGADAHCQALAAAAGAGRHTWRAYLSTQAAGGQPAVNARDRIGAGPWRNANGVVIAQSVAELHGTNTLTKQTALTERGTIVNGRGDTPNTHDILTGSRPDGTSFPAGEDMTCRNWTSGDQGSAMLGHADRQGTTDNDAGRSWNSSHPSRGCNMPGLISTGGAGLLYCFAID